MQHAQINKIGTEIKKNAQGLKAIVNTTDNWIFKI